MAFELLLERLLPVGDVRVAIDELLTVKRLSREIADGPRIPVISEYLETELAHMQASAPQLPGRNVDDAELDAFFRHVLANDWPSDSTP